MVTLGLVAAAATPAFALTLDEARGQGLIGERPDGLVGAVAASPSAEVKALVDSVNTARLASYKDVAQKNGTPLDAVQMIAGEKQVQKAKENRWFVLGADGAWSK
ncbi:MAG: DUF1318 domain-containing protein [Alphaproteobacteria bacterium]|nr:DUF1318 domain-containing protein [Alphaproteobacteria bacterium]